MLHGQLYYNIYQSNSLYILNLPDVTSQIYSRKKENERERVKPDFTRVLFQMIYLFVSIFCMHAKLLHSCLALGHPTDCSLPGSSLHGILKARIPEWVAMPSSTGSSRLRDRTCGSCFAGQFFTAEPQGKINTLQFSLLLLTEQLY